MGRRASGGLRVVPRRKERGEEVQRSYLALILCIEVSMMGLVHMAHTPRLYASA